MARKWLQVTPNWLALMGTRGYSSNAPIAMSYEEFGQENSDRKKFPLIIMHGMLGSKQNWRGIGRILGEKLKRKVFTVDARNHGESPHTEHHSTEAMSEDVKAFMQSKNLERATVVGHSMGGRCMMYFTMKYPELVYRTIIVDISPGRLPKDIGITKEVLTTMYNTKFPNGISASEARKIAANRLDDYLGKDTINFLLMNLKRTDEGKFYWAANLKTLSGSLGQLRGFSEQLGDFPPYKGPVHFIVGSRSNFVNENDMPLIKKFFPSADMIHLNAGHLVHFEQPEQFVDAVVDFVNH